MPRSFVLLCASAILLLGLPSRAEDLVVLSGSIRPVKVSATAEVLTPEEMATSLDFSAALKMRNYPELQKRLSLGEKISAREMAERYEPRVADSQTVVDWLESKGFTITHSDSHHVSIFARGSVDQIASAFRLKFARVQVGGVTYVGAITPPSVPAAVAKLLLGINGLQPWSGRR